MIILYSAVPGSGKSLSAVELIVKFVEEKRQVYTNIPLTVDDETGHFNIDPTGEYVHVIPEHNDWQQLPIGCVVIYDEAQKIFPATAKPGQVTDDRLTGLETHRHHGYDLIFLTQDATFLHHHIRKLVGKHVHLYRGKGAKIVSRYEWSHYCENPNDRREQERASMELWPFPKKLYKYYKSSQIHTHKFKIPKKIAIGVICLLSAFGYLTNGMIKNGGLASFADKEEIIIPPEADTPLHPVQASAGGFIPPPTHYLADGITERVYAFSAVEEAVPVSGCINYKNKCMCFSESGNTLELENKMCRDAMKSPLPRSINISRSGGSSRRT